MFAKIPAVGGGGGGRMIKVILGYKNPVSKHNALNHDHIHHWTNHSWSHVQDFTTKDDVRGWGNGSVCESTQYASMRTQDTHKQLGMAHKPCHPRAAEGRTGGPTVFARDQPSSWFNGETLSYQSKVDNDKRYASPPTHTHTYSFGLADTIVPANFLNKQKTIQVFASEYYFPCLPITSIAVFGLKV